MAFTPADLADAFTVWAVSKGILARVTEAECRDLADAFAGGCAYVRSQQMGMYRERIGRVAAGQLVEVEHGMIAPGPAVFTDAYDLVIPAFLESGPGRLRATFGRDCANLAVTVIQV